MKRVEIKYICEDIFDNWFYRESDYSLVEISLFGYIPNCKQKFYNNEDHKLTLRKNIKEGRYELVIRDFGTIKRREVYYKSKLFKKVLDKARELFNGFLGNILGENDKLIEFKSCEHERGKRASHCISIWLITEEINTEDLFISDI